MATFDQLPADQRAIIELVVRRGRSYEALADVLEIPPQRVRELARDALAELSPVTATRVDSDWRGQLADYLLGQQSGPESTATRGHLKRSEAARAWAFSLLDALDPLYENGTRPLIPEPDDSNGRGRRGREEAAVVERPRERDRRERKREEEREKREREEERERSRARRRERERGREPKAEETPERAAPLSPEARAAVRRRRILGAGLGAIVAAGIIAVAVLAATGGFSSSKARHRGGATPSAQILGEVPLNPVGNSGDRGIAVLATRGGQRELVIQAAVKQNQPGYAYEVWLYNDPNNVVSLGAQVPQQGTLQGAGQLPANFANYKYIDISYEKVGASTGHSGQSVMRGAFADIQAPPTQGSGTTTPGQTAPGQTAPGQTAPGQTTPTPTP